jgi:hypothetical protein
MLSMNQMMLAEENTVAMEKNVYPLVEMMSCQMVDRFFKLT